jgi:hypothetical protein
MSDENPLEIIDDLMDLQEFIQDDRIDRLCHLVVKLLTDKEPPPGKVLKVMNELQALSAVFALKAAKYSTIAKDRAGTVNNHKKTIYYSARDATDKLVDVLKYTAKAGIY